MSQAQNKSLTSPGLQKGLMVLEYVTRCDQPVSFGQLMDISQTPKSTLIRLLRVLRQDQWLIKDTGGYLPGPRLLTMLKPVDLWERLTQVAHPMMESLSKASGNTAALFGIQGNDNWVLCKSIHPAAVSMRKVGERQIMDWESPWTWIAFIENESNEHERPNQRSSLSPEIAKSIEQSSIDLEHNGWCYDDQVSMQYVRRLAVPIRDPQSEKLIGALSLGGNPLTIPDERIHELGRLLLDNADQIMAQL